MKASSLPRVAIIGMACRLPGARNVQEYWDNLRDGVEGISFFNDRQVAAAGIAPEVRQDPGYVKAGGVLDDIEMFDADFFGFSPREAEATDPQQRLFLECAWEAFENAGYDAESYDGAVGVYAGAGLSTYLVRNLLSQRELIESLGALNLLICNNKDFVPTRVSYKLNLKGPSINVNTACSTSLVAVHVACQSLVDYQCDMALAGGVGIQVPQAAGYRYQIGGVLSPDGRCRAFDVEARGTVSGNGVGAVVLKRLDEALSDGDIVRAVILGSAVNNDGSDKIGFTAPSVDGQAKVVAEALSMAGVSPETIGYIEAHGTGTPLGDPIEIAALQQVFRAKTKARRICAIGSVKTNIGHVDEAAGVAGLIKTVLALEHKVIPPSLHFQQPNPEIDFAASPFFVNARLSPWRADDTPRRAGVSSFGIGGTNAHVVLEEAAAQPKSGAFRAWQLLCISAKTPWSLDVATANLARTLRQSPDLNLADAAYTLHLGRKPFAHRRAVICRDAGEAVTALRSLDPAMGRTGRAGDAPRPVVFLFPGQGAQYSQMGLDLYRQEQVFRDAFDRCAETLRGDRKIDLRELLYGADRDAERLKQTAIAQPALFVFEYALARLLMSWGIEPQAMIGHSVGEYVAGCLSGVFSWEDALMLVAARGELMQQLPPGAMLAVPLAAAELAQWLPAYVDVAVINAPDLCVVSGPTAAIRELEKSLAGRGVSCRLLQTSHAFHSAMMDPAIEPFQQLVARTERKPPQIPYLSNVTGAWITPEQAVSPAYWSHHLRGAVRFSDGIQELRRHPDNILLEVGPGKTLKSLVERHAAGRSEEGLVLNTTRHPQQQQSDVAVLLQAVGALWTAGVPIHWPTFYAGQSRRRVSLPTYAFDRRRYWIEPEIHPAETSGGEFDHAQRRKQVENWFYLPKWNRLPAQQGETGTCPRRWLVLLDEGGWGELLTQRLREAADQVVTVRAGSEFCREGGHFTVNPKRRQDYDALVDCLREGNAFPQAVLHLWTMRPPSQVPLGPDEVDKSQYLGFFSLLFLAQALSAGGIMDELRIEVVSSNVHRVTGAEVICPEKATLLGPVQVIPKEFPNVRCRNLDIALLPLDSKPDLALVERLIEQLGTEPSTPIVALRGSGVWERTLELAPLKAPTSPPACLRPQGTYLITGGLGSMGLAFAKYLASQVRANLVLVGRSGLPDEESWDSYLQAVGSGSGDLPCHHTPAALEFDLPSRVDEIGAIEARVAGELAVADLRAHEGLERDLHGLCSSRTCEYLSRSGVDLTPGSKYSLAELKRRLRILPQFDRFLSSLMGDLAEDGIVDIQDGNVEFLANGRPGDSATLAHSFVGKYPEFKGIATLLQHCTDMYSSALTGEIPAISVLYPDGTADFMDACAKDIREYVRDRVYLKVVAEFLPRILADSAGRKVRILEVGGGGGALTRELLKHLTGWDIEYVFTDLSQAFIRAVETEAAAEGITGIKFGLLDISRCPQEQGYEPQSFDVVLGYNVVHATRRIRESIRNLKGLLVPGGLLCLVEATRLRRWDRMVWGLTEGWWLFEDEDLRQRSPLIGLGQWEAVLLGEGFENVLVFPRDLQMQIRTDAGLILAQQPQPSTERTGVIAAPPPSRIDARVARTIRTLREIQQLGSQVMVVSADVADRDQMERVFAGALERFSALHGVVHTAGVLGQGLMHHKTEAQAAAVLAPKVRGTAMLAALLHEHGIELDFWLLCSALSAIAPIIGQVDYCAANAFEDAFAAAAGGNTRTISINWGVWQELGMIEQANIPDAAKAEVLREIAREEWQEAGTKALSCILAHGAAGQIVVSPEDLASGRQERDPCDTPRQREPRQDLPTTPRPTCQHPLFAEHVDEGQGIESFVSFLAPQEHWVLDEHRPAGRAMLPGTGFLELAFAAARSHARGRAVELRNVCFLSPLVVADGRRVETRTVLLRQAEGEGFEFVVTSRTDADRDAWLPHARGEIAFVEEPAPAHDDLDALAAACDDETLPCDGAIGDTAATAFARQIRSLTTRWNCFRGVRFGPKQGLARLRLPDRYLDDLPSYQLHPALMDMATGFLQMKDSVDEALPFSYRRVLIREPLPAEVISHVRFAESQAAACFDVKIMDPQGQCLVEIEGYAFRRTSSVRDTSVRRENERQGDTGADENFALQILCPGRLDSLQFVAAQRRKPGPGEVEIEVRAAGLNFIEVLYALGLLPDPGVQICFGMECAGQIARVGEGVAGFSVGDDVLAYASPSFARYATAPATATQRMPANLTYEDAATIPAAFLTAWYALIERGRLQTGERVLIHAAAGGVGLAAVQIARLAGAEVLATAGTQEKQEFLRRLGIAHVMSSRSLDFAEEVMQRTSGEGVDVVLNSLGGDFIPKGLSVLRRYGRFLELGKRDIFGNKQIGLEPFANSLSFQAIDVGTDLPDFAGLWQRVMARFHNRELIPLPHRAFPIRQARDAFEYMAQAKHVGKVVLSAAVGARLPVAVGAQPQTGVPLRAILGVPERAALATGARTSSRGEAGESRHVTQRPATRHPRPPLSTAYRAAETQTEAAIAEVWQEIFGIAPVGMDDNFFDLNGDSLLAAQLMSRIGRVLQVKLPLSAVFDAPTIAELSANVERVRQSTRELQAVPAGTARGDEEEGEL